MGNLPDMKGVFLFIGVTCAAIGWVFIEAILWLFSRIHFI